MLRMAHEERRGGMVRSRDSVTTANAAHSADTASGPSLRSHALDLSGYWNRRPPRGPVSARLGLVVSLPGAPWAGVRSWCYRNRFDAAQAPDTLRTLQHARLRRGACWCRSISRTACIMRQLPWPSITGDRRATIVVDFSRSPRARWLLSLAGCRLRHWRASGWPLCRCARSGELPWCHLRGRWAGPASGAGIAGRTRALCWRLAVALVASEPYAWVIGSQLTPANATKLPIHQSYQRGL